MEDPVSSKVDAYEKLGAFYLGREVDPANGEVQSAPLLYDSKDLTTHAVCVGMTGSGKTGLCLSLLEEAAIDGVPAIAIDVKGDLGNLLLTFPELSGQDFKPWVDRGQASRAGQTVEDFADSQAELWRSGLAKWDQDGSRIGRLRETVDLAIYTPGSEAGLPISILSSFSAPPAEILDDSDLLQQRIASTAVSLLSLLGIDADPIQSREAILLSNVLNHAWSEGQDLDLASLIMGIQNPPFDKVGVFPLESFYPSKERFELAMSLNNLLASPTFQSWMSGEPLDVDNLLYDPQGKPRVSVVSIAHLSDAERMFFVSMLMNQVLSWMRTQAGTSSLRAIVYMDEVFGYLPPIGNPPSKTPMLTLLKQARAFGVGLVLATQNPVDLDYKALSNIGTWLLGRLQTERDKERVMDGLLSTEAGLSKKQLEHLISGLDKRVFLLHNVHEDAPVLFRVRWALSYLRGPLTRSQIKTLMADRQGASATERASAEADSAKGDAAKSTGIMAKPRRKSSGSTTGAAARPMLPASIDQRFLPLGGRGPGDGVHYEPALIGEARVHFVDSRKGLEAEEEVLFLAELDRDGDVDWSRAELLELEEDDLEREPASQATFGELPSEAAREKAFKSYTKSFADMLYRERRWPLLRSPTFELIAEPGESERAFRIRLAEVAREQRDLAVEKVRKKYDRRFDTLRGRLLRAEQRVEKERQQSRDQKLQAVVNVGTTLLGAFFGRKSRRRVSTTARSFSRTMKEGQDVDRAEESLELLQEQFAELEQELQNEVADLETRFDPQLEELETFKLKPRRTDVDVRLVALAWQPTED